MSLSTFMQSLSEKLGAPDGPDGMKRVLYIAQIALGAGFVLMLWRLRAGSKSGFAVREADLKKSIPPRAGAAFKSDALAHARLERKGPLALEGIRIDGPPHEVLGVPVGADEAEIQRAYRERMKQYHPDKIGRPGSREWDDAQKIAHAINHAKEELIKRLRARK